MDDQRAPTRAADEGPVRVPLAGAERALRELAAALRGGAPCAALTGPEGVGRSTALRELGRRLAPSFRAVFIPYAALQAGEICAWILGLLDEPAEGDPESALLAYAERLEAQGAPLVALVDDAGSMPVATARRLAGLLEQARGALRLVIAPSEDARGERVRTALGPALREVRLAEALSTAESELLVSAWLSEARVPDRVRARFDPAAVARLHAASGGRPARLRDRLGEALAAGAPARSPGREQPATEPEPGADPFAAVVEALSYVPREAAETALDALEKAVRAAEGPVLLLGPPGIGKTLLLRVLGRRLEGDRAPLYLPYPALPPAQLARHALTLLGRPAGDEPRRALAETATDLASRGTPLVLLLDDGDDAPPETLGWLGDLATADPGAGVVVAALDGDGERRALQALGRGVHVVRFDAPMSEEETAGYVASHLDRAGAPETVRHLFGGRALREIHREAAGQPGAVHRLADARIRAATAPPGRTRPGAPAAPAPPRTATPARVPPPRRALGRRALLAGLTLMAVVAGFLVAQPALWRETSEPTASRAPEPTPDHAPEAAASPAIPVVPSVQPAPEARTPVPDAAPAPAEAPDAVRAAAVPPVLVHINAVPWARVEIDGREIGVTPLGNVPLAPGRHRLRAYLADGRTIEREVEVDADHRHLVLP